MVKRNTWQREAVREALTSTEGFVSAQGLHLGLREAGSADRTRDGVPRARRPRRPRATRTRCSRRTARASTAPAPPGHHHHLICRNCGLTVEIEADAVEQWAQSVAAAHGFTQAQHVVDVFGLCAACSRA